MPPAKQILLPLQARRPDGFDNFVPGANTGVIQELQNLAGSGGQCVFLRGAEGSGKSHLLNAACNLAVEQGRQAFYISLGRLPDAAAEGLSGLDLMDLVCVDDMDLCVGNRIWEEALFHCFNRLRAEGGSLFVSSSKPLSSLQFSLPDLASRLAWGLRLQLRTLDDAGKAEAMAQWVNSREINLPKEVQAYLLSRSSRGTSALLGNLEAVCEEALRSKRKITVPLVREILQQLAQKDFFP